MLKFKASDREVEREKRVQHYERERDAKFKRKLDEWLAREEQKSQRNTNARKPPSTTAASEVDLALSEEI